MGFIFKIHQPFLGFSVHFHRNHNGTGIDFIRFFLVLQFSFFFQPFHGHQGKIHQTDKLILPALIHLFVCVQIILVSLFHGGPVKSLPKGNVFQFCGKSSMTAVVRPVGIQHTDFRHGRVSFFFLLEIILNVQEILKGHGKAQRIIEIFQLLLLQSGKSIQNLHILRFLKIIRQRFRLFQSGFSGIHRINAVGFDGFKLLPAHFTFNHIGGGRTDNGIF